MHTLLNYDTISIGLICMEISLLKMHNDHCGLSTKWHLEIAQLTQQEQIMCSF